MEKILFWGICFMLSMFKVSSKTSSAVSEHWESRFFSLVFRHSCLLLKTRGVPHQGNFRRWKHPAKSQPGVASLVLPLLFCPRLWFTVGQNKDPNLCRETWTPRECLDHPWAWPGSLMTWRTVLSWHWIFVDMGHVLPPASALFLYAVTSSEGKKKKATGKL